MKRVLLAMAMCSAALAQLGTVYRDKYAGQNYGVESQGPDVSPYAKRARKGKGQRKAHRAGRWG